MSILTYPVTQSFKDRPQCLIRQTLKTLLNERTTRFKPFKPQFHCDVTLKIVFWCYILYFASPIMLMDGLLLDNDFRTPFPYFIVSIAGVAVTGFVFFIIILLFCFIIIIIIIVIIIIIIIIILYSLNLLLFF